MRLDRNMPGRARGKYGVIRWRNMPKDTDLAGHVQAALDVLADAGMLVDGAPGAEDEFFVLMLKDRNTRMALLTYADRAARHDKEYADEIRTMAGRASGYHPFCKDPD